MSILIARLFKWLQYALREVGYDTGFVHGEEKYDAVEVTGISDLNMWNAMYDYQDKERIKGGIFARTCNKETILSLRGSESDGKGC